MHYTNLLAKIEAEFNKTVEQQLRHPNDVNVATKKNKLKQMAMDYIKLENQFKEIAGLNGVY